MATEARGEQSTRHIREILSRRAEQHPDQPMISAPGRAPTTYGGMRALQHAVDTGFAAFGFTQRHRVGIVVKDRPVMGGLLLAVMSRFTAAPVSASAKEAEVLEHVERLRFDAIIIENSLLPSFAKILASQPVPLLMVTPLPGPAGSFVLSPIGAPPVRSAEPRSRSSCEEPALVLQTSGTTSRAKTVLLSQENLIYSASKTAEALSLGRGDIGLSVMPLHHVGGIVPGFLTAVVSGGTVIFPEAFNPQEFVRIVREEKPTWMTAVPSIFRTLVKGIEAQPELAAGHSFRFLRVGAAAMPPEFEAQVEELFSVPLIQAYGMTESAGLVSTNRLAPEGRRPGTVGLANGTQVRTVDDTGNFLPDGAQGEFVIRGPNVVPGYETETGLDVSAHVDGWLRTGDMGHVDERGFLHIFARKKEIIKRGGETLSPHEIEAALQACPEVEQAVAFGCPDEVVGEEVHAAVILRPGSQMTPQQLMLETSRRLQEHKVPKRIYFVSEFPLNGIGKLARNSLAAVFGDRARTEATGTGASSAEPSAPTLETTVSKIMEICSAALGKTVSDPTGDFFSLGGDSVLGAVVITKVNQQFGLNLSLLNLYMAPVVSEFSAQVHEQLAKSGG